MLCYDAVPEPLKTLLGDLAAHPALKDFSLGGGTSLALRFGHRISVDLDFFTTKPFLPEVLYQNLVFKEAMILGQETNTLTLITAGVKLDLLRHGYPLLGEPDLIDGVRLVSLSDVSAMKLNAIANRGSKKDFYDLVELLNHFTIHELIKWFEAKYQGADPFTVIRSLAWFADAELEPDPVSLSGQTWERVKVTVSKAVAGM